jgi:hypothetical protein
LNLKIEVQEYKKFCQKNDTLEQNERQIISKMNHIIETFISNRINPPIRIDINNEMARDIIEKSDYLSPYLFLEANVTIYILFK